MRRYVKQFASDVCGKLRDIELVDEVHNIVQLYYNGKISEFEAMFRLVGIERSVDSNNLEKRTPENHLYRA